HKLLEGANIKLAAVATDVLGKSGREMLEALIGGEQRAEVLAELARGRLRAKLPPLRRALEGRVQPHHGVLLTRLLAHMIFWKSPWPRYSGRSSSDWTLLAPAMTVVQSIPGIQATTAGGILAEIGIQMERFPSDKHLASWAGVCPGNKQSGGKRL